MSPRPQKFTVLLRAVTPLFLGGAEPNARAEWRPPGLKGLLRYWYRALDGDHTSKQRWQGKDITWEQLLFGSADSGQAPCLLRTAQWIEGTNRWEKDLYSRSPARGGFQRGSGTSSQNGIIYLGYSLTLKPNDRKAIPAGTGPTLDIEILPRPQESKEWGEPKATKVRRAWLASLWLLVHVGGMGTRSRRGLGSLRIEQWSGWPECEGLPLPCQASTSQEWIDRMQQGLATLRQWFPNEPDRDQTAVKRGARFLVLTQGHPDWEHALDDAGLRLQQFRRAGGAERAGFGLPLTFRNPKLSYYNSVTANARLASPVFIRIVALGQSYHAAFIHLPAPFPPPTSSPASWPQGGAAAVQTFLNTKVSPDASGFTL